MFKHEAIAIAGTLSKPSKMPGFATGTPAAHCNVGSKLAKNPNSPCHDCYAKKGFYALYPSVKIAQQRRLEGLENAEWPQAMTTLIERTESPWFRWHDSGDIQSYKHLENIVAVCKALPQVKFWLPTREYGLIRRYLVENGAFPENLTVRVSAAEYDAAAPTIANLPTSQVHKTDKPAAGIHECPARYQGNACGDCRACWDPAVKTVSYHQH